MDNEDNEFFILVLGVLAAIIMVISWWFTSGGISTPAVTTIAERAVDEQHSTDESGDDEPSTDEGADRTFESEPADEDTAGTDAVDGGDSEAAVPAAANLLDAMLADDDLSVITNLFREDGLDQLLSSTSGDSFTVFAPSNDAISAAAGSDTTVAVLEGDRTSVLQYHIVPGSYTFDDLVEFARGSRSAQLATLQGEPLGLMLEGESLVINGNTVLLAQAQTAATGVVHTVDNVLVPPVAALNTIVAAEPILFSSGSADIAPESFATLARFIEVLAGNDVAVSIEGHTDSSGDPILNQNLSQSRARSVLNYLVANGIDESRLSAIGFGPSQPVADNNSEAGRALNRRIEFKLN